MINISVNLTEPLNQVMLILNLLVFISLLAYSLRMKLAIMAILVLTSVLIQRTVATPLMGIIPEVLSDEKIIPSEMICAGWNNLFLNKYNTSIAFLGTSCASSTLKNCPVPIPSGVRLLTFDNLKCPGPDKNCEPGMIRQEDIVVSHEGYLTNFSLKTNPSTHWFFCDANYSSCAALNFRCQNCKAHSQNKCALANSMVDEDSHSRMMALGSRLYFTMAQVQYCKTSVSSENIELISVHGSTFSVKPRSSVVRTCTSSCQVLVNKRDGFYDMSDYYKPGEHILISVISDGSSVRRLYTMPFTNCLDLGCVLCYDYILNGCADNFWFIVMNWSLGIVVVLIAVAKGHVSSLIKFFRRTKPKRAKVATSDDEEEEEVAELVTKKVRKGFVPIPVTLFMFFCLIGVASSCHSSLLLQSSCIGKSCNAVVDFAAIQGQEYCFDGDANITEHFSVRVIDTYYYANTLFYYKTATGFFKTVYNRICSPTCTDGDCNGRESTDYDFVTSSYSKAKPIRSGCHTWETPYFEPCVFGRGCYWWSTRFYQDRLLTVRRIVSWNPAVMIELTNGSQVVQFELSAGETKKLGNLEVFAFQTSMPEPSELFWVQDDQNNASYFSRTASEVGKPETNKLGWMQHDSVGNLQWNKNSLECTYNKGITCEEQVVKIRDLLTSPLATSKGLLIAQKGGPVYHEDNNPGLHLRMSTISGLVMKVTDFPCEIEKATFTGSYLLPGRANLTLFAKKPFCFVKIRCNNRVVFDFVGETRECSQKWTLDDDEVIYVNDVLMHPEYHLVRPLTIFANESLSIGELSYYKTKIGLSHNFSRFCKNAANLIGSVFSGYQIYVTILLCLAGVLLLTSAWPIVKWLILWPIISKWIL